MSQQVKILAFPIFRRYWLYHAWQDSSSLAATASTVKDWRKGVNLEERLSLLGQQVSTYVRNRVGPVQHVQLVHAAKHDHPCV
jgi:hypothetical protein